MAIKESDLYNPLKTYLEKQGYSVSPEVHECDLVAVREDEVVLIELKTRVTVALLIQASRRKDISDSVYIAVPVPQGKSRLPNYGGLKNLLKRLEVGLILVRFMKTKTKVETVLHPRPFEKRMRRRKQAAILREIDGRYAEFHEGGIPTTVEKITAYKQESIKIAYMLLDSGPSSPKSLRDRGARADKTQTILSRNHYGWFDRIGRGIYELNGTGREALKRYEADYPEIREIRAGIAAYKPPEE